MSLKKFFGTIIVIISIIGAVVAVMRYFESERIADLKRDYDAQIAELTRRVGTIERRLGSGGEFLDVRHLWLDAAQVAKDLPKATYHSKDRFYAPTHGDRWVYELTTNHAVIQRQLKRDRSKNLLAMSSPQPLHMWRGKATYEVTGNNLYRALVPGVSVQRITRGKFSELIKASVDEGIKLMDPKDRLTGKRKENLVEQLKAYLLSDAAINLFLGSYQLMRALTTADPKTDFELIRLQKLGNVLYGQYLTTLREVKIDRRQFAEYYIWSEMIIISTEKDIYAIGTTVPTGEPAKRHRYFSDVTQWLAEFAVLKRRTKTDGAGKAKD